jgi:hypothetical protein
MTKHSICAFKTFNMRVQMDPQTIAVDRYAGNRSLQVSSSTLTGERVRLTAMAPTNGNRCARSGLVHGSTIKRPIQSRGSQNRASALWSAPIRL